MTSTTPQPSSELSAEGLAAIGLLSECDREPIHRCGAIQPHGVLLAVDPEFLTVSAASANAAQHLRRGQSGDAPFEVLGADLAQLLGPLAVDSVVGGTASANPHEGLPVRLQLRGGAEYDMVSHLSGGLLVLELEPVGPSSAASAAFYQRQRSAMQRLGGVDDVDRICRVAADEVRALTGYDGVRIYRFEPDAHGIVVAESCAPGVESYLGLHYPAGDIPRQARALYLRNWIRVIGDVGYEPVPIITRPGMLRPDEFDLSMSVLRSVSPVHLQYLRNMGVRASMSISLVVDNQLWGLIACHHRSPRQVGQIERLACETIGQLVSVRLRSAQSLAMYQEAALLGRAATQVVTAMVAGETPALGAVGAAESLLGMVAADGAVVDLDGMRATTGDVPEPEVVDRIVAGLAACVDDGRSPFATESLASVLAEGASDVAAGPSGRSAAGVVSAGALFVPFSGRSRGFVLWLRGEHETTVRWAGRPNAPLGLGTGPAPDGAVPALTPRASFEEWREQRRGCSAPWRPAELAAAAQLVAAIPDVLLHRSQSRLVRFALHDPLTGLPNRRLLRDRLDQLLTTLDLQALGDGAADPARPAAGLLFVELTGLTARGSSAPSVGDDLLPLVAERLRAVVAPNDTVARMGGDEFVVLVPGADVGEAGAAGERIVEELRRAFVLDGRADRSLSVNVGVTSVLAGTTATEALRQADAALYHARRSGPNEVSVYDAASGTAVGREQHAGEQLRRASVSGQLLMHYQAVVDLTKPAGAAPVAVEAVLRWQHPVRGMIAPEGLVPGAVRAGLLHDLDRAVVAGAVAQLRALPDDGPTVSINVSARELVRADFVSETVSCLAAAGIDPGRLCIEVQESQLMEQPQLALVSLRELSAAGLGIAIDDFGTGFSSLAAIRRLPRVLLKVSASLVAALPADRPDLAVVTAVVQVAHALGWRTVAEGVHTTEQLAAVRDVGLDYAQGDLFGQPIPARRLELPSG